MSCSLKGFNGFGAPCVPVRRRVGEVPSALLLVDSRRWWNVSLGEVEKERLRDTSRCREAPLCWKLIAEEDILGVEMRKPGKEAGFSGVCRR